jgi:hypothetical protein
LSDRSGEVTKYILAEVEADWRSHFRVSKPAMYRLLSEHSTRIAWTAFRSEVVSYLAPFFLKQSVSRRSLY